MSEEGSAGPIDPGESAGRRRWAVPACAVVVSAVVILAPVLRGGYLLRYDMVFAPHMPIGAAQFGLGSQLPRAVPSDLVVAALSHVLPGALVQDGVLFALVLAAGFGAARLAAPTSAARTAAALAYIWTAYFGERILLGQWAVLLGWALLPWVIGTAHRVRNARPDGKRRAWARFVFVLGLQCLGGLPAWTIALLTAPVAVGWGSRVPAGRRTRRIGVTLLVLGVYALPWALPALLRPGGVHADPTGARAFAPAPDIPLGTVMGLLTGGGIWNSDAVPPGRNALVPALGAVLLVGVGLIGVVRRRRDGVLAPLAVSAVIGLGVAVLTAWPAGARAFARLPLAALLRDSQRLLAPWVLLLALGLAAVVADLAARPARDLRPAAALIALLPVAVLPALAWGIGGRLAPVDYPSDFARLRAVLAADQVPGAVVVLPFQAYRRFGWDGGTVSADPLSHWLDRPLIGSSDLPVAVGSTVLVVHGEDRLATRVASTLSAAVHDPRVSASRALGRLGVRWIVADARIGSAVHSALETGTQVGYRGSDITAFRIPADQVAHAVALHIYAGYAAPVVAVVVGDVLAAVVLVGSGLCTAPAPRRRRLLSAR